MDGLSSFLLAYKLFLQLQQKFCGVFSSPYKTARVFFEVPWSIVDKNVWLSFSVKLKHNTRMVHLEKGFSSAFFEAEGERIEWKISSETSN